jgi:hypothetical protein
MSTLTTTAPEAAIEPRPRRTPAPIPATRIIRVELRKMFDTRAGFWLMASVGILATLATAGVIAFAPDDAQTLDTFATAFGFPMAVILPMIAILSVTSEWSQRSGLTTFTQVPHRGRVIAAKAVCTVIVGVVSMFVALGIGSVGNLVGTAISGAPTTWDLGASTFANIVLAQVLGMMVGFMLGVLIRSSAGAIVAYFIYAAMLPTALGMLAAFQEWFRDLQPWVDFNFASTRLYDQEMTGEYWAQLGVSGLAWLVVPLAVGLYLVRRSEVK